jgi:hypothetical protein
MAAPSTFHGTTPVAFGPVAGTSEHLQRSVRNIPTHRVIPEKMSAADTTRAEAPWSANYHDYFPQTFRDDYVQGTPSAAG